MARILLVEDNENNRDMLSRRLARKGHDVSTAVDGQEAVNAAQSDSPDLILMDMSLPVIDGWEATRLIRSAESEKRVPIIALTAHAMESDRGKAIEAGCDEFETKPVRFDILTQKINALLERDPTG